MGLGGAGLAVIARGAPVALAPLVAQLVDLIDCLDTAEVTGLRPITTVQTVTTVSINLNKLLDFCALVCSESETKTTVRIEHLMI